jgi:hypothetical protein
MFRVLNYEGFQAWLDEVSLLPGVKRRPAITSAIKSSDVVIVFLPKRSVAKSTALGSLAGGKPAWTSRRVLLAQPPDGNRPSVFFTRNMQVASERLKAIEKQDHPLKIVEIATLSDFSDLWFTPETDEHAHAYFIEGDNTPEFRARLTEAADAGLLRNKQIALAISFDENESEALWDMLLYAGALMVWYPRKRISPGAANKLRGYMERVYTRTSPPVRGLDDYIERALQLWLTETGFDADPDLKQVLNSANSV